ncbi:MAG: LysR family transcriptional regulator [Pseudomonadales bacterium]
MAARGLSDLRKLRHVVGVARAGSFTSASHALNITQSALTKSVAELEHLLGLKLFERLPRGVRLTEIGEAFVPRAERLLADSEDLMADMDQLQSLAAGHLKIGIAPAAFAGFLEHTVSAFAQVYPGVSIEVRDGSPDDMARAAINGQIDLVVGGANNFAPWKELETVSVAALQHFFIGCLEHPVPAATATARALLDYPVIMPALGFTSEAQLTQAYLDAGMTPRPPRYICDHFPLVRMLVAATHAISPVVSLAAPGRRYRSEFQVYENVISLEQQVLGIAFSRSRPQSPGARAFVDIFQGFLQDSKV